MVCKLRRRHQKEIAKYLSVSSTSHSPHPSSPSPVLDGLASSAVLKYYHQLSKNGNNAEAFIKDMTENGTQSTDVTHQVVCDSNGEDRLHHHANQATILVEKASYVITEALSIVRAATKLEVGVVPKTTVVRWKAEDEFEIRYFQ